MICDTAGTWTDIANNIRKLADENPDLRETYLAKLKVIEARDLTNEQIFLDALKGCDPIMGELEEQLAKQWKGKFGKIHRFIFFCETICVS